MAGDGSDEDGAFTEGAARWRGRAGAHGGRRIRRRRRQPGHAGDLSMALPSSVRIVEVGPRDGLQNEKAIIPTAAKIELIDRLSATALRTVEATSFVSPTWVPQLAAAAEVYAGIARRPGVLYPVLVPNARGYETGTASVRAK